jgi:hypothetical protein
MTYLVREIDGDDEHQWAVVQCACDLSNDSDDLVIQTVAKVREAYGENEIIAATISPDPSVERRFNLTAITKAFRRGLPDPEVEENKKPHLTNYRSETTEILAREALFQAYAIEFPTHPQRGKTNVNQPILGFDGWGILGSEATGYALVLVQVKGTEDRNCPPREASTLALECQAIPQEIDKICHAVSLLVMNISPSPLRNALLQMLESLSEDVLPGLFVAPVIIRGIGASANIEDLRPIRDVRHLFSPAISRGVTVALGVPLTDFGQTVMSRARTTV